jgi:hypothetical protein
MSDRRWRHFFISALVVLAGCSHGSIPEPDRQVDDPVVEDFGTPDFNPSTDDMIFIGTMRKLEPYATDGASDGTIVDIGRSVCDVLDTADSIYAALGSLLSETMDSGYSAEFSGHVIGAAVPAYCPWHSDELDEAMAVLQS